MFNRLSAAVLAAAVVVATASVARVGAAWLERVVQYHKDNFFKQLDKFAPYKFNAEIRRKPLGYVDSADWDYESVVRLLTLLRQSEATRPIHKALRRMLQPTRRLMMSMKESMKRFPSLAKQEKNNFYYDVEYTSDEESLPPAASIPEDEVVLVVTNPVEARLPSARISVRLLREILEARARAARQMPDVTRSTIPWKPMNRTLPSFAVEDDAANNDGGGGADNNAGGNATEAPTTEAAG